jgi:hypothetical protein
LCRHQSQISIQGNQEACNLDLGKSTFDAMFLTLSFEGVSPHVFANQSIKKRTKKLLFKNDPRVQPMKM